VNSLSRPSTIELSFVAESTPFAPTLRIQLGVPESSPRLSRDYALPR